MNAFAPTHVTISGASEARVGDAVSLSCATSASNPAAAVKWVVAGKQQRGEGNETAIAPEGGWITKSNITVVIEPQRRSVVVVCHGINAQLTDSVVATHTIHVFYPPSAPIITGYVPGTTLAAGAVQKLQCISTGGNPLATLTWYKNDKKIHSQSKTTDKSVSAEVSILTNVSDNMAVYRCAATNSATTVPLIDSVTLSVHFAPETVKVRVEPTELHPGTEARLYCDAASSNPPAQLSWWRDGIPVQGLPMQMKKGLHGGTVSYIELKLNVSKEHNGAVYTCQAMNEALQRSVHDALALKVLYAPIFDVPSPPPSLGVENQTLTITATATGSPDNIVYTWTRDGLPITRSQYTQNERIISVGSSLTISSVSRHDAGVYTVEATNSRGAAASNVTLVVQYSASIKSVSQNGITSPNEDAILTCTADGFPLNSEHIRWERAGYEIDPSKISFDPKNLTSYLLIENPTRQDVGNFTCIVNNGLGRESRREVMLVVPFKPEMDVAPSLAKVAANTGQSVELTCRCLAAPQPTFTWTKDNTPLPVNTSTKYTSKTYRNSLTYTSVLVINAVTSKDYGSYKCEASNYLGGESTNVELTATAPPDMVGPLTVVNVTQSTITISWSPGFDGGLPVRYRVRYRKIYDESYRYEDVTPRNATHFTVTGLDRGTAYLLSVMAINRIGQSKYRPDDTSATTLASSNPGELSIRPSEHGDMSNGAIVYVSVTAAILVIVNAGLVACFLLKRRSRRLKEQAGQASKAATIEMYAPSSYNETVTGDTLSSVSDKSETYSEPAGCPPVPAMPRTQPQDTYLTDPGLVLPPPLDYPDYPPDYALHARTLPRQRDMQNKVTYAPAPSPMPPLDGSYYNMSSDRYLSYPPLIGEYLSQQANRPPMSGYATTPRPHVLREENEMSVDAPQGYEVDVSERQSLSGTLGRRPALSAAPPPPDVTRTQLHNSPQHPATPPTVKQPQSILKCPNRTKQNNYDYGSPLSSSSPQNTAQILTVHNLSNEVPHYGTIRKDKNKQTLN
ncbi:unnamed protein product [Plutella xylostella]|uniref:(diamondback moth) hypothetical protein n=1 Tax=Plutella xylostella TaxID=51655 RepID=A0A8S4EJK0_PLUXY|nr:unnamed protein product [Plutella xylostella]